MEWVEARSYRDEIDGIRMLAVTSVFLFHLGFLENGYLGVDIFFAISGFLITGTLYRQHQAGKLSIQRFYIKRFRRILPLVLATISVALSLGIGTMLPGDLENLSQSVIATSFFANNVLSYLTIFDYWDVWNEYKPLMHTWSLGIEEQYYFLYPFIFLLLPIGRGKAIHAIIFGLAIVSFGLYLWQSNVATRFYLLQYRFWELAAGGLLAISLERKLLVVQHRWIIWAALVWLLCAPVSLMPAPVALATTVLLTCIGLGTVGRDGTATDLLVTPISIWIGKISFSLYMWHQIVLAFARYTYTQEIDYPTAGILIAITAALSICSYFFIEEPFRRGLLSDKVFLAGLLIGYALVCAAAGWIYLRGGIVRDVPELGIVAANPSGETSADYNDRVYAMTEPFDRNDKLKIFVVGNSFARDFANIILESKYSDLVDISYSYPMEYDSSDSRWTQADIVVGYPLDQTRYSGLGYDKYIDTSRLYAIGTKNFGVNNGLIYNGKIDDYCSQQARLTSGCRIIHRDLQQLWGNRYINLLKYVSNDIVNVDVFTDDCQFFSHDTRHLTKAGAEQFGKYISSDPTFFLHQYLNRARFNR